MKQDLTKDLVYVLNACNEFTAPDSHSKEIPDKLRDEKDLWPYGYATAIGATREEYMGALIPWLERECQCGDDSFFDYIPAAIEETLQWAAAHGHEFFMGVLEELKSTECLRNTYDRSEENDSEDTLGYLWDMEGTRGDFLEYFELSLKAEYLYIRELPENLEDY